MIGSMHAKSAQLATTSTSTTNVPAVGSLDGRPVEKMKLNPYPGTFEVLKNLWNASEAKHAPTKTVKAGIIFACVVFPILIAFHFIVKSYCEKHNPKEAQVAVETFHNKIDTGVKDQLQATLKKDFSPNPDAPLTLEICINDPASRAVIPS